MSSLEQMGEFLHFYWRILDGIPNLLNSHHQYLNSMKKSILLLFFTVFTAKAYPQTGCNWQTLQQDGFEYTTPIPDLLPGIAVHSSPMATGFANGYVAYAGTYAMYLNFIDCNGGIGTCAGAQAYERTYTVCPGMPVRIRAWMTTMFSGAGYQQSDLKLVIRDANGVMLDSVPSLLIPFRTSGGWIEYISGTVTSTTPTIIFQMFTNVDGGQGNDLTVDEVRLQGCIRTGSQQVVPICSNGTSYDLYNFLPSNSVNNGSWSGPSVLAGGYLGTFQVGSNATGNYTYLSTPYSSNAGCPSRTDTVFALPSTAPAINLPNDTALCLGQSLPLSAGGGAFTYLWNTGSTFSGITASNPGTTPATVTYSVTVTNQAGCSSRDSITIDFINCSGIGESPTSAVFSVYPNPADDRINIRLGPGMDNRQITFSLIDPVGRVIIQKELQSADHSVDVSEIPEGLYLIRLYDGTIDLGSRLLRVR